MKKALKKIGAQKKLFLFFDFDGTLCPIAPRPQLARLPKTVKNTLKDLSLKKDLRLAVVSGRALKDVKGLVGLKGLLYAGNHGLEIKGPGLVFMHPKVKKIMPRLDRLHQDLIKELRPYKNAVIEHKGLSLSLHYRLLKGGEVNAFRKAALSRLKQGKYIKITFGKKVIEVRPKIDWDKGRAVKLILKKTGKGFLPIYFGDDITDLDAFSALRGRGLRVWVGKRIKGLKADLVLPDTGAVERFLKRLKNES